MSYKYYTLVWYQILADTKHQSHSGASMWAAFVSSACPLDPSWSTSPQRLIWVRVSGVKRNNVTSTSHIPMPPAEHGPESSGVAYLQKATQKSTKLCGCDFSSYAKLENEWNLELSISQIRVEVFNGWVQVGPWRHETVEFLCAPRPIPKLFFCGYLIVRRNAMPSSTGAFMLRKTISRQPTLQIEAISVW